MVMSHVVLNVSAAVAVVLALKLMMPLLWWARGQVRGWRAGPNAESSFVVPNANSCRFVFPTMTAPAWRSWVMSGASLVATWPSRTREAAVVAVPAMSNRSLIEIGTPCSGPRSCPAAISR